LAESLESTASTAHLTLLIWLPWA